MQSLRKQTQHEEAFICHLHDHWFCTTKTLTGSLRYRNTYQNFTIFVKHQLIYSDCFLLFAKLRHLMSLQPCIHDQMHTGHMKSYIYKELNNLSNKYLADSDTPCAIAHSQLHPYVANLCVLTRGYQFI